jgi:hypothetical protein
VARYLSVEETAELLGTTDRTVRRMLNSGRLSGSQHLDKGKMVWRVHATKDILQKLEGSYAASSLVSDDAAVDLLDAEIDDSNETELASPRGEWTAEARTNASSAVDQFWNQISDRFIEKLEAKDQLIGQMQNKIEEKDRQLRLLPDFEKRAEDERKANELKELEVIALKKHLELLEASKEAEIQNLRTELETLKSIPKKPEKSWLQKLFSSPES